MTAEQSELEKAQETIAMLQRQLKQSKLAHHESQQFQQDLQSEVSALKLELAALPSIQLWRRTRSRVERLEKDNALLKKRQAMVCG